MTDTQTPHLFIRGNARWQTKFLLASCVSGEGQTEQKVRFKSGRRTVCVKVQFKVHSVGVSSVLIRCSASFFFCCPLFLSLLPLSLSVSYLSELTLISADRHTQALKENGLKKSKSLALSSRGLFSLFFLRHNFHFFPLTWLHSPLRTSFFPPSPSPPPSLTPSTYLFVRCSVVAVFSFAV